MLQKEMRDVCDEFNAKSLDALLQPPPAAAPASQEGQGQPQQQAQDEWGDDIEEDEL